MFSAKKIKFFSEGIISAMFAVLGLILATPQTKANTILGFSRVLNASGSSEVSSQLSVEAVYIGGGQVRFDIKGTGVTTSRIRSFDFNDDDILPFSDRPTSEVTNNGTSFKDNGGLISPQNLLAGDNTGFSATSGLRTEGITSSLWAGRSFQDTVDAMNNENLRVGLNIQSIGAVDGSAAFVSGMGSGAQAPEPNSLALLSLGLAALALRVHQHKRKNKK